MNGKLFSPSKTATYNDINFGIPSFMTCIESVIFSLIFHWSFSSSEYQEGSRLDRFGTGPAARTKSIKAIGDALNLSDIVSGTIVAFQLLFTRVQSRYGAKAPPQRTRTLRMEDQVHLEPLSHQSGSPAYAEMAHAAGMTVPPAPMAARDPSPGGPMKARTFRADEILRPSLGRTNSYQRMGYSRNSSPGDEQAQRPRQML